MTRTNFVISSISEKRRNKRNQKVNERILPAVRFPVGDEWKETTVGFIRHVYFIDEINGVDVTLQSP